MCLCATWCGWQPLFSPVFLVFSMQACVHGGFIDEEERTPLSSKQRDRHDSFGLLCEEYEENYNNMGFFATQMWGEQVESWPLQKIHQCNPQSLWVRPSMAKDVIKLRLL